MIIEQTLTIQNNKEIPVRIKCGVFTVLRIIFNRLILHRSHAFETNTLYLKEHENMCNIETNISFDYKNNKFTSKCAQIYVSPNFTSSVIIYVSWRGNVSSYTAYIEALHRDWDIAVKQLEERGEAYVNIPNTLDHKYILQRIECMEHAAIISDKTMESNNFTTYDIKYADEYRPELYY